jgi:hypothetical protein
MYVHYYYMTFMCITIITLLLYYPQECVHTQSTPCALRSQGIASTCSSSPSRTHHLLYDATFSNPNNTMATNVNNAKNTHTYRSTTLPPSL